MMIIGTVVGPVYLGRVAPGLEDTRWVQVRTDQRILTAADPVGTRPGELVLIVQGSGAAGYRQDCVTDALILGIVEDPGNNG